MFIIGGCRRRWLPAWPTSSCRDWERIVTITNPQQVYDEIKDAYLRYIDTAYWLRSEELMSERRQRLTDTDLLFTDVLLEPVVPSDTVVELREVIAELRLDPRIGDLVGSTLFGAFTKDGEPSAFEPIRPKPFVDHSSRD